MAYVLPTPTEWVTASWYNHCCERNPPSSEPGTDYGSAYGSECYAVGDGTITYTKGSNSSATGRVIEYRLDDGRTTRSLHLSAVWVGVGQRVGRGQVIGLTGASGFGDDWYYGSHEHHTLWPGGAWAAPTIDFEPYVGDFTPPPPPEPEPPERTENMRLVRNTNDEGGSVRFYAEAGWVWVTNVRDRNLLHRFITEDPGDSGESIPIYNNLELDIIANYIAAANAPESTVMSVTFFEEWPPEESDG